MELLSGSVSCPCCCYTSVQPQSSTRNKVEQLCTEKSPRWFKMIFGLTQLSTSLIKVDNDSKLEKLGGGGWGRGRGRGKCGFSTKAATVALSQESSPIVLSLQTPFFLAPTVKLVDEVEGRLELTKRSREQWTLSQTSNILFQHLEGSLELNNFKEYSQFFTGLPH